MEGVEFFVDMDLTKAQTNDNLNQIPDFGLHLGETFQQWEHSIQLQELLKVFMSATLKKSLVL